MRSVQEHADICHAESAAARGRLLAAVAELQATESWRFDGARDFAAWLAARWQTSIGYARELVRDAEDLKDRPALTEALAEGAISPDQCRAIATLAKGESEG